MEIIDKRELGIPQVRRHKVGEVYKYEDSFYMVCSEGGGYSDKYTYVNISNGRIMWVNTYDSLEELDDDNQDDIKVNGRFVIE